MESQLNAWKGEFGKAYTDLNNYDWCSRVSPWSTMLDGLSLDRILEVGCNRGLYVRAIIEVLGPKELVGVEPNPYALGLARRSSAQMAFLRGNAYELLFRDGYFDLAFTCGVLIHVPLEMLPHAQAEAARVNRRYVPAIEYFAETETVIPYRGHNDLLWKRNFLDHYHHNVPGLRLIREGYWQPRDTISDANWWLFEKE